MKLQFSNTIIWRRVSSPESQTTQIVEMSELLMHSVHLNKFVSWQSAAKIMSALYASWQKKRSRRRIEAGIKSWNGWDGRKKGSVQSRKREEENLMQVSNKNAC